MKSKGFKELCGSNVCGSCGFGSFRCGSWCVVVWGVVVKAYPESFRLISLSSVKL